MSAQMLRPRSNSVQSTAIEPWLYIAPELHLMALRMYGQSEGTRARVCPDPNLVFRALELVHPERVKVVILGQDPYHTPGKASGLSFGYHPEYSGQIDSSLQNIANELRAEGYSIPENDETPVDGVTLSEWRTLEHLARQGVLLLNTRLTVEAGRPMSHADAGWELPIGKILQYLADQPEIVWMLWGNEAHNAAMEAGVDPHRDSERVHTVSHPCRYSHMRGSRPFTGSGIFRLTNEFLESLGEEPIIW